MQSLHRLLPVAAVIFASAASTSIAAAANVNFEFNAALQTGALAGTTFTGTASYDDAGSTGVGIEFLTLTSLNFTLDGFAFTHALIDQGGQVILDNGTLSYFTAAFFPGPPAPVDDIAFGFGGPGIIGYSTPPGFNFGGGTYEIVSATPEPSAFTLCGGALLAALLLAAFLLNRKRAVALFTGSSSQMTAS